MSTLEYINDVWPEHDRSSCSDDNLSNAGIKESGCCYCRRCQGLYELRQEQQIDALKAECDALKADNKALANAVLNALYGTLLDEHGNRDENGLLAWGKAEDARNALIEVATLARKVGA